MKKPILAFFIGVGSICSVQAQDSTAVESSETNTEEVVLEEDLFAMDFEDLLGMEITSVSKKAERLQDVAASIYVVTSKDIQMSGATTLFEILRTVPGFWGMQDEYSSVYSSMRNSPTDNGSTGTVLYLLDGTPIQELMSSTFSFRNFDIPLDEIDRIEVIRGSGGTVYGANSATGVVNIFTKNPEKYDGINAKVESATPGYLAASVRAGGKVTEKLSVSGYGKYRKFAGYGSLAGKDENGDDRDIDSRFTEDYETSTMMSFGLKGIYNLNEKSKISLNTHYNTLQTFDYTNTFNENYLLTGEDVLFENDVNSNRLVANLKYDYTFNDNHSIFVRASTNTENDFNKIGGGSSISNSIYDFEIQDNISIGKMNELSIGANYRLVNFDIHDINDEESINYIDPQSSEAITGAFIQDKIKFLEGKLNLLVGLKAENYTLINSDFYISPMAKVSFIPWENLTIWGGFTQSYTTPGYNNTNIDLALLRTPAIPGFPVQPASLKNSETTEPTQFSTLEFGFRSNLEGRISIESNIYYTQVKDAIAPAPYSTRTMGPSPTDPDRQAEYLLYGNYEAGTTIGTESLIKIKSTDGITFELSHSYLDSKWEVQENDDFEIDDLSDADKDINPEVRKIPKHVFRIKGYFDLPSNFTFSMGVTYATKFATQAGYNFTGERFENVVQEDGEAEVGINNQRTIINLRIQKTILDDKLTIYAFGNDIFNEGLIANTVPVANVTISQIKGMYGLGANYKF